MKNDKIKIVIEDDLTPQQEVIQIAKKLNQKLLSGNGTNKSQKIRIGQGFNLRRLTTEITIERKGKYIEFIPCHVCGCEYQNNIFFKVFQNYGGKTKILKVCSVECQENLIEICGEGRAGKRKADLKPFILFNH